MKKTHSEHLLIDYIEGELSASLKEEVDAHLGVCQQCRDELRSLKLTFSLLEKDALPELDSVEWANFVPHVRQKIESGGRFWDWSWLPRLAPVWASIGAALALFILSFYFRSGTPISSGEISWIFEESFTSMDAYEELAYMSYSDDEILLDFFDESEQEAILNSLESTLTFDDLADDLNQKKDAESVFNLNELEDVFIDMNLIIDQLDQMDEQRAEKFLLKLSESEIEII
ncbi:MAG: hypothetical protein B6244_10340 [Candidatus Cloacimonetes bacterium 4572_55]|nr:MAG: hypothetical protein B6244_10340 [Candidatus Cloacimonetes bacterium 4572_55]